MQTKLYRYPSGIPSKPGVSACLGNFDGIHLGHKALLDKISKHAKQNELKTMLVSFYPHPALVLKKANELPLLTPTAQMLKILSGIGIDYLYLIHFTYDFSKISAEEFITKTLIEKLNITYMIVGEDARIGAGGQGDAEYISRVFSETGRQVEIEKFVEVNGTRISSRLVRASILEGDVKKAAQLLGRSFSLAGRIVRGQARGKSFGFPTANLHVSKKTIIPEVGVYATFSYLAGTKYRSVTNIGLRPTLDSAGMNNSINLSIETYIMDYDGPDFYNQKMELQFINRIRNEKKFSSIEELKKQIALDIEAAKRILT